jgi:hypothetical protein
MMSEDPEFGPPEDWCEEDEDDVEATREVFELVRSVIASGYGLDSLCVWEQEATKLGQIRRFDVSINQIEGSTFRFFENSYFAFRVAE